METLVSKPEELLGFRGGFFNKVMHDARDSRNWTLKDLAIRVSTHLGRPVSSGHISSIESLRKFPKPDLQESIAATFGLPVSEIFPPWLSMFKQERAIKEVPVEQLSALAERGVQALEAFNPRPIFGESGTNKALREAFDSLLEGLTSREREVIELRFGFSGRSRTLEEVANVFSVTRERIRQIESNALRKLLSPARARVLRAWAYTSREMLLKEVQEFESELSRYLSSRDWYLYDWFSDEYLLRRIRFSVETISSKDRSWARSILESLENKLEETKKRKDDLKSRQQ